MICQECGKKQATAKIRTNINGVVNEYNLCSECAAKMGYSPMNMGRSMFDLSSDFFGGGLLNSFFGLGSAEKECPTCSTSLSELKKSGQAGCSDCYDVFGMSLLPLIQRLHGNVSHIGKDPTGLGLQVMPDANLLVVEEVPEKELTEEEKLIESKQKELKKAVAAENYEQAAVLRDEIKALQQKPQQPQQEG